MQEPKNKHLKQYDITQILRERSKPVPPPAPVPEKKPTDENSILSRIEEDVPMPPKRTLNGSGITGEYVEALQLMTPQKSSFLDDPKREYFIRRAAKKLGYRMTYRVEDHRGVKLHRWWITSTTTESE